MTVSLAPEAWLVRPRPNPAAALRLFCFPYAGGGISVFRGWPAALAPDIEVCPIRLPGRESRLRETPFRRIDPLVEALLAVLRDELERPFALFGHSMGALVSFELCRALAARGLPLPVRLLASGHLPPQTPRREPPISTLPESEFLERLRSMGGTPPAILDNAELMSLFLPLLRADLAVADTYHYRAAPPLPCPITAFGGEADSRACPQELRGWAAQTASDFSLVGLPGNHFFLHTASAALLDSIRRILRAGMGMDMDMDIDSAHD